MRKKDRPVDPLPDEFASAEEAGEFWDTHDLTDYEEYLEPADLKIDIKRRHFEIEVDEEAFLALSFAARKQRKPVKRLASEILKEKLCPV